MSRHLESRIDIEASPEHVWRVLTDFAAYAEWNPFITRLVGTADVGQRLRVRISPPDGMAMTLTPRVTISEPGRHFAWLGRLGLPRIFDGEHEFVLEPDGRGGTTFTQRETFRGVLVPFVGAVLRRTHRGFEQMNDALKQRSESLIGELRDAARSDPVGQLDQSSRGGGSSPKKPVTRRMRPPSSSAMSTPAIATVPSPPTSSHP
jgi:hypothetical protein